MASEPKRGAIFVTDKIRYNGLIANIGARLEYWAPGRYVDNAVNNALDPTSLSTIPAFVAQNYLDSSTEIFGLRYKFRFLPKINVSFPVRENQVLFFNYGHSTRIPHPSHIYAGLDPFYQDQSDLPDLGNPNLTQRLISLTKLDLGIKSPLMMHLMLLHFGDKYDFVTTQSIRVQDVDGRNVSKAFRINGDYARSRGVELSYIKRYKDLIRGQLSFTYSRAEGLSSTNDDNLNAINANQNIGSNVETPLAWDRPFDIKGNITFTYDRPQGLFGWSALNDFQIFLSGVWRSGTRYTPMEFIGLQRNPVTEEKIGGRFMSG